MGCVQGKTVLTEEDLNFIAEHTAVSRQEVDEQYENFLAKHPEGKITKKEFKRMIQQCYPKTDTDKLESHIFRMYDANGDGYIDFREFMMILYVMSSGTPQENLKQIFRVFDINNDGAIQLKEMCKIVKDLFHLLNLRGHDGINPETLTKEVLAQTAFSEMDANHDGKITQEEFVTACMAQEKFSRMLALGIIDVFISE